MPQICPDFKRLKYLSPWNPSDTTTQPKVQVVTCFLQRFNKFLILQRARKDNQYKLWGIPGGKLDKNEQPVIGLTREIHEELGVILPSHAFRLIATAMSQIPFEERYGLYLYHAYLPEESVITINLSEHYDFKWVTLDQMKSFDLLTAQLEAIEFVECELKHILNLN